MHSSKANSSSTLSSDVDLYVDYSTCVSDAVRNSNFFQSIRPRITGASPTLYAIKGSEISRVSSDINEVNHQLNNILEISYADIHGAISEICDKDNQAILITDGEYWTQPEGERTDLPYMKDSFIKWLNKGNVVHVITENYKELYHGQYHDKKRFYFFFTNDKLEGNIYKEISKSHGFQSVDVGLLKLSNSDLEIDRTLAIDENLTSKVDTTHVFDFVDIDNKWKDINDYVMNAIDEIGNPIPIGNPLIKGGKFVNENLASYMINDLELKAYDIYDQYLYLSDTLSQINEKSIQESKDYIIEIPKGFEIVYDHKTFSVNLSDEIYDYININDPQLIRIDIILKDVQNKKIERDNFSWPSLSKNGTNNISVYESIQQAIDNLETNPTKRNNGIIHTVFIKSY